MAKPIRNERLEARLSKQEDRAVKSLADLFQCSVSDWLRAIIQIEAKKASVWPQEEKDND